MKKVEFLYYHSNRMYTSLCSFQILHNMYIVWVVKWIQELYRCSAASASWLSLMLHNGHYKTSAERVAAVRWITNYLCSSHILQYTSSAKWEMNTEEHATLEALGRAALFCVHFTMYNERAVQNGKWTQKCMQHWRDKSDLYISVFNSHATLHEQGKMWNGLMSIFPYVHFTVNTIKLVQNGKLI